MMSVKARKIEPTPRIHAVRRRRVRPVNRRTSARSNRLRARWAARSNDRAARAPAVSPEGSWTPNACTEAVGATGTRTGTGAAVLSEADARPRARTIGSVVVSDAVNGCGALWCAASPPARAALCAVDEEGCLLGTREGVEAAWVSAGGVGFARGESARRFGAGAVGRVGSGVCSPDRSKLAGRLTAASSAYFFERGEQLGHDAVDVSAA